MGLPVKASSFSNVCRARRPLKDKDVHSDTTINQSKHTYIHTTILIQREMFSDCKPPLKEVLKYLSPPPSMDKIRMPRPLTGA